MPSFWDSSIRLDLLLSEAIGEMKAVDRITEKLKRASGVAQRLTASLEVEADKLIAREADIEKKTKSAFQPHHAVLDSRNRELDQLEDALKIISNADPLDGSSEDSQEAGKQPPATFQG